MRHLFLFLVFSFFSPFFLLAQNNVLERIPQELPFIAKFKIEELKTQAALDSNDLKNILLPRLTQMRAYSPERSWQRLKEGIDLGIDYEQSIYTGLIIERDQFEFWGLNIKDKKKFNDFVLKNISQKLKLHGKILYIISDNYTLAWDNNFAILILPKWAYVGKEYENKYGDRYTQLKKQLDKFLDLDPNKSLQQDPHFLNLNNNLSLYINQGAWWRARHNGITKDTSQENQSKKDVLQIADLLGDWTISYEVEALSSPTIQWKMNQQIPKTLENLLAPKNINQAVPGDWWKLSNPKQVGILNFQFKTEALIQFFTELFLKDTKLDLSPMNEELSGQSFFILKDFKEVEYKNRKILSPQFLAFIGLKNNAPLLKTVLVAALEKVDKEIYKYKNENYPWDIYLKWEEEYLKISNDLAFLKLKKAKKNLSKELQERLDKSPQSFWINWEELQKQRLKFPNNERLKQDQLWQFLANDLAQMSLRSSAINPLEQRLRLEFKSEKENPLRLLILDYLNYTLQQTEKEE